MTQQTKENLPASSAKLQEIIAHQRGDPELAEVRSYCQKGWPAFMPQNPLLHQYWTSQRHLTIIDYIFLYNDRIVIPRDMGIPYRDAQQATCEPPWDHQMPCSSTNVRLVA
ncbi:Pol polyprotein [Elysia marginata]|uniref:Pol polyprotein n=1 Tax=Elysia marginata TaxID=1093978 RepID=A0AAV4I3V9_9GAST|nr:Pol polyprotein [Elysia marginata]